MGEVIQFHLRVPARIEKDGDLFVASCAPLDIVSQGESKKEALDNLSEAIRLFVDTAHAMGTLDQVLEDCGFVQTRRIKPGNVEKEGDEILDVPLPLLVARKHAQAHAR